MEGVLANRTEQERLAREEPDNAMRIFGEAVEARGSTSLGETLASAMERGIQRGVERASAAIQAAQERATERLTAMEGKLEQIPQYGPRIEMSRGFPVPPSGT